MIIYRSFYEAINELSAENQATIWRAVMELGFNGVEIELSGLNKTIFTLIKQVLIKRYWFQTELELKGTTRTLF